MIGTATLKMTNSIFNVPIDAYKADMLPQIELGLRELFKGHNPYRHILEPLYVPWPLDFGYGPGLWLPYIVPYSVKLDPRTITVYCSLAIPTLLLVSALRFSHLKLAIHTLATLTLIFTITHNQFFLEYIVIGHTQVYWPIIWLFSLFLAKDHALTSAFFLALLVLSRTTMISIVPIFMLYLYKFHKNNLVKASIVMGLTILIPLLPFALLDFQALLYNMITKYPVIVKKVVWTNDWIFHTFGITGFLIKKDLGNLVFPTQIIVMTGVYLSAFHYIKNKKQTLIWMSVALMMFSMTTIWPVTYIYLDVIILFIFSTIFQFNSFLNTSLKTNLLISCGSLIFLAIFITCIFGYNLNNVRHLNIGHLDFKKNLYKGFYDSEKWGGTSICWSKGDKSILTFIRSSSAPATIELRCLPFDAKLDMPQTITVILNGYTLGTKKLHANWNKIRFEVQEKKFIIGNNLMDIRYAYSRSPKDIGYSMDERKLAVAFDTINIIPLK